MTDDVLVHYKKIWRFKVVSKMEKSRTKSIKRPVENKHKQMNDGVDLLNEQGKIGKDVKMRSFYGHSRIIALNG